jgi:hypothetical protein
VTKDDEIDSGGWEEGMYRPRKSDDRQGNREEWPGKRCEAREEGEEAIEGQKRNRKQGKIRTGGEETAT